MLNLQKISIILITFILFSCAYTTPEVKLDNIKVQNKLDFKVALVMSEKIRNYVQSTTINAKCRYSSSGNMYKIGTFYAINHVGKSVEEIFVKGLPYLFRDVDIYNDLNEIKNRSGYDLIVLPEISATTWYDREQATNREEAGIFPDLLNPEAWEQKNCFPISAKVEMKLRIINASNDTIIGNFSSPFIGLNKSCWGICSNNSNNNDGPVTGDYSRAFSVALNNAFSRLLSAVESDMIPLAKSKSEESAMPSSLALTPSFNDTKSLFPNTTLDAGEDAEILITVKNDGKGSGYGTALKVSSDNPKVTFDKEILLGDIPPGVTKEIKIPVKAGLDLADGTVPFNITCTEKRGYNCKNYKLEVQSAKLEKPELVITGYKINDGNTGLASGNGNGISENGETIEIIPLVKNSGVGDTINVDLSIESINDGLDLKTKRTTINRIAPGQTATGTLAFSIPTTFSDSAINLTFSATDIRGLSAAGTSKQFALNTEINKPVLSYTYKIIDSRGNVRNEVQNGEYAEIEIKPFNRGQLEAKNIMINLASATAAFTKKRDEISRLGAQAEYSPIRFPFQVPRVTDKSSIDVAVRLDQKDFPGVSDTINIPIKLVRPGFKVTYQMLDQNGNGMLEQGETADLLVRVENIGQLDAEGVILNMDIVQKGISIIGTKEANIGRLEARKTSEQKRFSIAVQRSADPGQTFVNFIVSERTFGNKNSTLALNIAKEQEEVITVKGQDRPKQPVSVVSTRTNFSPVIAIALPRDNDRVASEQITVSGVATAEKGISQIEISINGKRFEPSGRGARVRAKETDQRDRDFIFENIPLQAGANRIIVTVYDNENLSSTKTITVHRETKQGEIYAAVIGINQYHDNKLNLRYARNDAESFADYLRTNLGLDKDHLFELYDERATTKEIKSLLGKKIRQKASRPEDTVYVFFAGHGAPEQDVTASDEDKIRKYILSYDSAVDDLYATGIPMDEIAQIFSGINAERIIFVIDSCYSGAGGGRTILAQGNRAVLSEDFLNRLSQGKGRIILTSSKPNEVSKESDELKHGYFTYYLLEGLKGKADINGDGIVDLDEISFYLNKIVPVKTDGDQHPVKKGESEGTVVIGRVK